MNKVVISACYGGFGISKKGALWILERLSEEQKANINENGRHLDYSIMEELEGSRHHPLLVEMVETLGTEEASDSCAELVVKEISGNMYRVTEYDGYESLEFPDNLIWTCIK